MKAIFFDRKPVLKIDFPRPVNKSNEALIKVILAGICATDKEIIKGYQDFKGILGHEFVGVVEACDRSDLIGKRVVGAINIGCGECELCLQGRQNHCSNRKALGIHNKDGAFAEYLTLPIDNLVVVPDNISDREAVFSEPLAAAIHALDEIDITLNHKIAVMGDGKLGLLVVNAFIAKGCDIYLFGKHPDRGKLVKGLFLFENYERAANYTDYFDVVIECSGVPGSLSTASQILKPKGTIVLKSTYAQSISLDPSIWVRKEIKITGSRCGNMQEAVDFLKDEDIELTKLIEAEYNIDDWEEAFKHAFKGSMKVLLKFY